MDSVGSESLARQRPEKVSWKTAVENTIEMEYSIQLKIIHNSRFAKKKKFNNFSCFVILVRLSATCNGPRQTELRGNGKPSNK